MAGAAIPERGRFLIINYGDGACPQDIDADICIIGAGVAGLSVARSFIGTATTVCIVAGGGMEAEERYQSLYEGSSIGNPPFDPAASRMRAFGGTCNLWGRGCIPLGTALDQRDWIPHSGWPLTYAELESDYRRARAFCGIESHDFAKGSFLTPPELAPLDFDEHKLVTQIFAASPVHFGSAYRSEFERAPNVPNSPSSCGIYTNQITEVEVVDEGLGACFFGIPPDRTDAFREAFDVPAAYTPIGAITVGHRVADAGPSGSPARRGRRTPEEVVHRGRW